MQVLVYMPFVLIKTELFDREKYSGTVRFFTWRTARNVSLGLVCW